MSNTTETYWAVDGVSLQTFAFNITTLGGDRKAPPPLRGSNQRVPYMPGTRYVPKVVDERTITLGMWVQGSTEDGKRPTTESAARAFDRNWHKLRSLLWRPRKEFTLTKRFWVPSADLVAAGVNISGMASRDGWTLYTASAKASYAGGLNPTMQGQAHGIFTVDLHLSDPYFYGDPITVPFSMQTGGSNPGPTRTIHVLGDDRTTQIEFEIVGPVTSGRMANTTEEQDLFVQYGAVVPAAERAVVQVQSFKATHYPIGDPYKASGYVQHGGDQFWLYLEPGDTNLSFTVQAGTGTAILRYRPVWL